LDGLTGEGGIKVPKYLYQQTPDHDPSVTISEGTPKERLSVKNAASKNQLKKFTKEGQKKATFLHSNNTSQKFLVNETERFGKGPAGLRKARGLSHRFGI